ncbi:MAG: vitamin K epoxide reductase family protein [Candidatus Lutacidiplasmatales archaeon]
MASAQVLHRALLLSLLVGLAFSTYAGFEKYFLSLTQACTFNLVLSCGGVLTSGHTTFPPGSSIEDWYWGVGGFVAMIAIDIPLIRTYDRRLLYALFGLSLAGLALVSVFAYTQAAIIQKVCIICVGSYIADIAVVACAAQLVRLRRRGDQEAEADRTAASA